MRATAEERFWAKVDRSGGMFACWVWTGYVRPDGYASFWDGLRVGLAHRWSYEAAIGPIPRELQLDHLCRNRRCVNPAHLEAVTCAENLRRGLQVSGQYLLAKTHCPQGHPYSGANLYRYPSGGRACRICRRELAQPLTQPQRDARNARRRAARAAAKV